jgi:hypothetical protein
MIDVSILPQETKSSVLAVSEVGGLRIGASLDDGKLYLLEVLALHASSLLQSLLRVRKDLTRNDLDSERNSMRLAGFALEVECLNELRSRFEILFRNSFGNHLDILRDTHNLTFSGEDFMDFAAVSFVHTNRTSFFFVVQLCLFDECCNEVLNSTILGD